MSPWSKQVLDIQGWNVGFQRIEFTNMLQRELGLGLAEAKNVTDRILEGHAVQMNVNGLDFERVSRLVFKLGAIVVAGEQETTCP